jgi:hypothetical protein
MGRKESWTQRTKTKSLKRSVASLDATWNRLFASNFLKTEVLISAKLLETSKVMRAWSALLMATLMVATFTKKRQAWSWMYTSAVGTSKSKRTDRGRVRT